MSELKGVHVLLVLLVFFGVTIAVNVTMATFAVSTFSGEDVSDPYLKGLAFNATLGARSAQERLGWTATIDIRRGTAAAAIIVVAIKDRQSRALTGLTLEVMLRRPTNANLDRIVALKSESNGHYSATVPDVARGQWDAIATAKASDGISFEATRRVMLQ